MKLIHHTGPDSRSCAKVQDGNMGMLRQILHDKSLLHGSGLDEIIYYFCTDNASKTTLLTVFGSSSEVSKSIEE